MRFWLISVLHLWCAINTPTWANADQTKSLKIGLLTELSGPMATNGEDCRQGFLIAQHHYAPVSMVGSRTVEYIFEDTQGDGRTGMSAFKKLTAMHKIIAAIITRAQVAMPINPISKQLRLPFLGVVGHSDFTRDNPYAFRFWQTPAADAEALGKEVLRRNFKRVASITLEDEYTLSLSQAFHAWLKAQNVEIVFSETVTAAEIDFGSIVTRLRKSQPDAIFINLAKSGGMAVRKLREQGLIQQIFSNFWIQRPDTVANAGEKEIEGTIFVEIDLNRPKFLDSLQELFKHRRPTAPTYACYCALALVLQTLKVEPQIDSAEDLYARLVKISSIDLLDESVRIKERDVIFQLKLRTMRAGVPQDLF